MKFRRFAALISAIAMTVSVLAVPASAAYGSKNYIEVVVTASSSGATNSVISNMEHTTSTYGVISVYKGSSRIKRVDATNVNSSGIYDKYCAYVKTSVTGTYAVGSSSAIAAGTTFTGGTATAYY